MQEHVNMTVGMFAIYHMYIFIIQTDCPPNFFNNTQFNKSVDLEHSLLGIK